MAKPKTARRTPGVKKSKSTKAAKPRSTAASKVKVTGAPPKKKSLDKARKKVSAKARQVLKDSGKTPRGPRKVEFTDDVEPITNGKAQPVSPAEKEITLGKVLEFHKLSRAKMTGHYKGTEYTATNTKAGVKMNGEVFSSLSAAARSIAGRPIAGWNFWSINGRSLFTLRREATNQPE